MAEFLTTIGTSNNIEKIIINAQKFLVLVSPYLQISKNLYERLLDAANRKVAIKIIYGKNALKPEEWEYINKLKNVQLYFYENLHAKCYFNENEMVITSMNMYEFSERNNREMGIYINRLNDKKIFTDALNETQSIIQNAKQETSKTKKKSLLNRLFEPEPTYQRKTKSKNGYCIRCGDQIKHDVERPFCYDCYSTWSIYENFNFPESICHSCGEYSNTSMEKPECYSCYTK
ncbi:hypothetical protein NBRC110019_20760 [Neptunitalea chrysea]|uniref:Phospholipase D-like domain-containing protein n=1 Tax=Neptunitalea chrysea TaxID=1647581 RepID=A0A9W6B5R7_9FLAO|nr:phospholipase D family protein [Neptunitalea chrysea]GLB53036.1 hypothetical protein NBRC110019_20760 [Neptunitalea chrysea]